MNDRDQVRQGVQRAAWRLEAGRAISGLSFLGGAAVVVFGSFWLGVGIMAGGIAFGTWFAYFS